MQILYTRELDALTTACGPFRDHVEPLLGRLEVASKYGHTVARLPIASDYLAVCRWPFRQLEYSYVLEAIAAAGLHGGHALDAGSGVTPFGHTLAWMGFRVTACDCDRALMEALAGGQMEQVYGSRVSYEWQDLTALRYPNEHFDLVTCVSVLEHISAPADQTAVRELLRVLRPGGHLIFTVDYEPAPVTRKIGGRYLRRLVELLRRGDVLGVLRSAARKARARRDVRKTCARHLRTSNQPFMFAHLQDDLIPVLGNAIRLLPLSYAVEPLQVHLEDVPAFWNLVPGLYDVQGRRAVLPAAIWYQKPGG
jgi:2-polyprenyl-3-methyl-5-hydroxy-6-metoxy-1,4-benzoquinol methylase